MQKAPRQEPGGFFGADSGTQNPAEQSEASRPKRSNKKGDTVNRVTFFGAA